jgi:hypothetical protein
MNDDAWKSNYIARIKGGLQFTGVHQHVEEWIKSVPGAKFNRAGGVSYINGVIYFNELKFESEADLLAFKLKFTNEVF